jgi:hypothetical protein
MVQVACLASYFQRQLLEKRYDLACREFGGNSWRLNRI